MSSRGDNEKWYGPDGEWLPKLEQALRQRPSGKPDPTDQDHYWDGEEDEDHNLVWHDNSKSRETELGEVDW